MKVSVIMFCCPYCGRDLERIRADKKDGIMINHCQNPECGQFVKVSACKNIEEFDKED